MSRERALEATQRALAALDRLQAHLAKGPPAEVTDEEREAAKAALERPEVRARVARLLRGEE